MRLFTSLQVGEKPWLNHRKGWTLCSYMFKSVGKQEVLLPSSHYEDQGWLGQKAKISHVFFKTLAQELA